MVIDRRDYETIQIEYEMDPARRELYVEGRRDYVFLCWLLGHDKHEDAIVVEIDEIDSPSELISNNRARLLHFAIFLSDQNLKAKCFADADYDRVLGNNSYPSTILFTDHRDLESYLQTEECFEKLVRLGLNDCVTDPSLLLAQICAVCRRCAFIRIASLIENKSLKFKDMKLRKFIEFDDKTFQFNEPDYLRAIFQNSGESLSDINAFAEKIDGIANTLHQKPDVDSLRFVRGLRSSIGWCETAKAVKENNKEKQHIAE